jgi:hypothetical protein
MAGSDGFSFIRFSLPRLEFGVVNLDDFEHKQGTCID